MPSLQTRKYLKRDIDKHQKRVTIEDVRLIQRFKRRLK